MSLLIIHQTWGVTNTSTHFRLSSIWPITVPARRPVYIETQKMRFPLDFSNTQGVVSYTEIASQASYNSTQKNETPPKMNSSEISNCVQQLAMTHKMGRRIACVTQGCYHMFPLVCLISGACSVLTRRPNSLSLWEKRHLQLQCLTDPSDRKLQSQHPWLLLEALLKLWPFPC